MSGNKRGVHVLTAMKALSPLLHESFVEIWDTVIPRLIQYIEGKTVLKLKLLLEQCGKGIPPFLEFPYPVHTSTVILFQSLLCPERLRLRMKFSLVRPQPISPSIFPVTTTFSSYTV